MSDLKNSVFARLPDHVVIAADRGVDGLYTVHAKTSATEHATFPHRVDLHEAIFIVEDLRKALELPEEAVFVDDHNDKLLNKLERDE